MKLNFSLNGEQVTWEVRPNQTFMEALRKEACFSVKHGCESGECGACAALVNGELRPTCVMLAAQAEGAKVVTAEALGHPNRLNHIHQAFLDCGGAQCGYCTPAMVLATSQLLAEHENPTEQQARECLSGVLCRCTGYVKPVEAILRAAALVRGEEVPPVTRPVKGDLTADGRPAPDVTGTPGNGGVATLEQALETADQLKVVGRPQPKLDGPKLVTGRPAFVDDVEVRGLLHARLLLSPHAHARIVRIDASRARSLPGVHAVLTHQDIPRVSYTSAGQSWPEPSPHDMRSLDDKVRFVGDRVAAVAAETPEIAARALALIEVEYEVLPAVTDLSKATADGAPIIHDEPDSRGFGHHDFSRNIAAQIIATHGDVAQGFAESDFVIERTYQVPKVQQTSIEPHVTITYWDEDGRLVVRTSTQVPFHVRRIIAPLLGLPLSKIRVIKPRIGGGFGGKQEVLIEDICGHLTMATGRPVKLEYTRAEEFMAARSRHPQIITLKTGVKQDGTIVANEMRVIADTGAYGSHALTVQSNTGVKVLPIYRAAHLRFECTTVYTNLPPSGAFRGYGVPQGAFAMESQMDEIAAMLGMDPMELRAKNWVRVGDVNPLSKKMNEGKEGYAQEIRSCGLAECVAKAAAAIGYHEKRGRYQGGALPRKARGVGGAIAMQGSAIPGVDMGGAMINNMARNGAPLRGNINQRGVNCVNSKYFYLTTVADGVYAAIVKPGTGAWGNAGIVDLGDRTVVFDTFATPQAARDLKAAAEELTGRAVSVVVNSHRHIDHVGGNQAFEGAEIITTGATRDLIATRTPGFLQYGREHPEALTEMAARAENETDPIKRREAIHEYGEFQAIFAALPEYRVTVPTFTFEGRLTLHGSKRTAELWNPGGGHTPSDTVLWLPEERILFAGDVVQVGFHPMIGQGSFDAWVDMLQAFADLAPVFVVPGHGPVADAACIKVQQRYFAALRKLAAANAAAMPPEYADWEAPSVFTDNLKALRA